MAAEFDDRDLVAVLHAIAVSLAVMEQAVSALAGVKPPLTGSPDGIAISRIRQARAALDRERGIVTPPRVPPPVPPGP